MWGFGFAVFPLHPLHDVKISRTIERDGILVEQIRHHDKVSVGGELVRDEVRIDETMTDHVGDADTRHRQSVVSIRITNTNVREVVIRGMDEKNMNTHKDCRTYIKIPFSVLLFSGYLV